MAWAKTKEKRSKITASAKVEAKAKTRPYPAADFERDIEGIKRSYKSIGRGRNAIYQYLRDAYGLRLKWEKLKDEGTDVRKTTRSAVGKQMVGKSRTNAIRLIVRLSAVNANDKLQAKYTSAVDYAFLKSISLDKVRTFLRTAEVTNNGVTVRGLNACQELDRRLRIKLAWKRLAKRARAAKKK